MDLNSRPRIAKKDITDLLTVEGYRPTISKDGHIEVKSEGGFFVIFHDDNDERYIQMAYPSIWIERDKSKTNIINEACNFANADSKLAKCYFHKGNVNCTVDGIFESSENFVGNLARYLSALRYCSNSFVSEMRKGF
ncbi:hypothetical protein [Janthinobacterium sp. 75]|uniref:hypothetical protein n=1 Tax=Janthinobacterium sp. 75 TaxID=2135628 RepID=UPI001064264A|nr:hypothetical protein [Janthinobacterium sp. 75]TDY35076.1 hypothetical protein C8C89_2922 [Janthinobacterium sp. 75]